MPSPATPRSGRAVALLLSAPSFEWFYEDRLNLDRATFLASYRNDWSWEYLDALRLAGFRPHLYIATEGPPAREVLDDGTVVRFLPLGAADLPWRKLPPLRRTAFGRYAWQAANGVALLPALRAASSEDRIATLFVQEYWMARWDVLTRRLDLPIVGVDQGYPERRDIKLFKRTAFRRARAVIAQTTTEADKVRRFGGDPVVLSNAVDTAAFAPASDRAVSRVPGRVISVAQLADAHKRTSDLIRAVASLGAPWTLELYGDGPDREMLMRLAASLGLGSRVQFHGFVMDRETVRRALQECSVFALPSAFEGLPMSLLEAMSSGAAVVGSAIPAITEVITPGVDGLLVPVGAVDALASAIRQADADRGRLGAAARETVVRRFSMAALSDGLEELVAA